ncbi:MAG: bifunctional methylenetetrahydrofolate dehydrogenase/methenyltetrahydrofolate cyclohydrolase [Candidatus Kerfeldbacteria bacterium RIFCSPHIGHO2_02_FULL_42_14]|uniref:Bifunctional protein FolD n=1 Tax=Candidatus Kerfeldbacteria bacterium RIFCSPHIGHO2_02_FULL_42_14 TaxID=1798540 RepID=A0A1G2ASD8_9BACT|nr:MAG: bifunctional methylenetetrahydrofolate dehydrogenase/methenyltetrahydrofolate cyclohydrolase [Candidatus Kerfeldbacteria bacterium RIFCSPHIGHO2_02_FULL_42_14]OGY81944.1 MAG: bifunctional methylenetetrahydrofolate dehydrogenase/methenyltetrahydrofolate cyclohydrolase [Candidatus Kerfeldbacteria bacterium RIFCSPHIGHO2_12_FULL_42_13]OGY83421.1 MAG: bifunctional methylenetetrahydrofolate dehydrogenase/methenyltetrahydrofolate cyclohydrolase [Candidatus Kerfeldbacteria bacterium RIFCSPLOWO2_02
METITKILNGSGIAQTIRARLKTQIARGPKKPGLAVILVGQDPASKIYVDFKTKASREVGMYLETYHFEENIKEKKLLKLIDKLNKNKKIHGILVQLPLPSHIEDLSVLQRVDPRKDVDGFHPENVGLLAMGYPRFISATPKGIMHLLDHTNIDLVGKEVVVIGASNIVGKPLVQLLLDEEATVTVCHEKTQNLKVHTEHADIIIVAAGVPKLLTADMVKKGVVVIDVGINKVDGAVVGDVDFEKVKERASYITPVPGGVGPMTVAMLLENTWEAMCAIEGYRPSVI